MTEFLLMNRERVDLENFMLHTPLAKERCRAQALLWLDEGEPVEQIAELLHVSRQTVYNWVDRFQQRQVPDLRARLADAPRQGRPPTALGIIDPLIAEIIDRDPGQFGYYATGWTVPLLQHHLKQVHAIAVCTRSMSLAIERLHLRWKRPRLQLSRRPDTWRQAKGGSKTGSKTASGPSF